METKRCSRCHEWKPLEMFSTAPSMADGRFAYCKPCHAANQARLNALKKSRVTTPGWTFSPPRKRVLPPERRRVEQRLARQGHGAWRTDLMRAWGRACAMTGGKVLLVGSHIKPWAKSTTEERLDPYNGLVLTRGLDGLFDGGWLTFLPDGTGVLHPSIDPAIYLPLTALRLRHVAPEHQKYLEYHRDHIYKGVIN